MTLLRPATVSGHLDAGAIEQLLTLVDGMRQRADDPAAWGEFLVARLAEHLGARLVLAGEFFMPSVCDHLQSAGTRHACLNPGPAVAEAMGYWARESRAADPLQPTVAAHVGRALTTRVATAVHRRALLSSDVYARFCLPLGVEDAIYSHVPLATPGWMHSVTLHRAREDGPFRPRELLFVRLLHEHLERLWRQAPPALPRLAPRLSQTLNLLAEGRSEKEVAGALGLSPHTIHNYTKGLHRAFGVSSRSELLARVVARRSAVPRMAHCPGG